MPYQVTFEQEQDGVVTRTVGVVDTRVRAGDKAKLKGQSGWWTVMQVYELPWVPIQKWKVGGL